jgi:hypothetical protein
MAADERRDVHRTSGAGRTTVQWVALIFGIGFLLATISGFMASGMSMDADPATAPRALGLFPVNLVHNIVHLLFALWGLAASRSFEGARAYCRTAGIIYLVLAVLGYVVPNGFGLVPLGGNDPLLHIALGLPLVIAGFTAGRPTTTTVDARGAI